MKNGGGLFKNNCLPTFEQISFIKAVQSSANEKTNFNTWIEALNFMKEEIDKVDFDVAILGCGAYAMPLGSYIKDKGKIAIVMAGVTQLLFGIRGTRWDSQIQYTNLYNDLWVKPSENETPKNKTVVEGGSYW